MRLKHLFSPVRLGPLEVRNRLVMPPMSVNFGVDERGFITERHIAYLAARARGGTGLIFVGGGAVHPDGLDLPRMPPVWDDRFIPALSRLADEIRRLGARIGLQLLHGGRQAYHDRRVAPSPLPALAVVKGVPRELGREEIRELVRCHAEAARRAKEAGFDCVEIHAAHGYLISEFLAPNANRRTDEYGGTFENRIRFLLEILRAIKARCGGFPVGVRFNGEDYVPGGWSLPEALRLAPRLEEAGADWLHVSAGVYGSMPVTIPSMYEPFGLFVHLAEAVKKTVRIPVIAVGRIKDPLFAERILAEGRADLVAMGRAHLVDPELARKALTDRLDEIRPCIGCCRGCIESVLALEEATCVVNPELGRESILEKAPQRAAASKAVLVVGAGPAGLTCARVLARRGHRVIVVDRRDRPGGTLIEASRPPGRGELRDMIVSLISELERLGVEIRLRTSVNETLLRELSPDEVVLATGANPRIPEIPGLFDSGLELSTVLDVLRGEAVPGARVAVLGSDQAAMVTADFLASEGREVTVLGGARFAPELAPNDRTSLRRRLREAGVKLYRNAVIRGFPPEGILFEYEGGSGLLEGFRDLILSQGFRPDRELTGLLNRLGLSYHLLGDAKEPRTLLEITAEADELGRAL